MCAFAVSGRRAPLASCSALRMRTVLFSVHAEQARAALRLRPSQLACGLACSTGPWHDPSSPGSEQR